MKRRSFLAALAGLPLVGRLFASEAEAPIAPPKVNEDRFYWLECNRGNPPDKGMIIGYIIDVIDADENRVMVKIGPRV